MLLRNRGLKRRDVGVFYILLGMAALLGPSAGGLYYISRIGLIPEVYGILLIVCGGLIQWLLATPFYYFLIFPLWFYIMGAVLFAIDAHLSAMSILIFLIAYGALFIARE